MRLSTDSLFPKNALMLSEDSPLLPVFSPGKVLTPDIAGKQLRRALADIFHNGGYAVKTVLHPSQDELSSLIRQSFPDKWINKNWNNLNVSSLVSINKYFGAVKVELSDTHLSPQPSPFDISLLILFDKLTMRPVALMDSTPIVTRRIASYTSVALHLLKPEAKKNYVFILGAGRVTQAVIDDLAFWSKEKVATVFVLGRNPARTRAFIKRNAGLPFTLQAVEDPLMMPFCDIVITATTADSPCYTLEDLSNTALVLHLGQDEAPKSVIEYALLYGEVICDDIHAVSSRDKQSLSRYFSDKNETLAQHARHFSIKHLYHPDTRRRRSAEHMTYVTCAGLPVADLYMAQHLFVNYVDNASNGEGP